MSQISSQETSGARSNWIGRLTGWLYAFWKFSRPHTVVGTSLSVLGLCLIAMAEVKVSGQWTVGSYIHSPLPALWQFVGSWMACLCGNVYIVGLNQLEDVEIDRINKPRLPLAAGEFSMVEAQLIVAVTGILALLLAWLMGPILLGMVGMSLAIGTAYSLPPIRLKRFPFWAALCIFSVRGAIVNLGLFLHFSSVWLGSQTIPPSVWALTLFILMFTFAIAILKDIPDMEGDWQYHITTLTIQLGQYVVFDIARWVLTVCYVGMALAGIFWLPSVNPLLLVTAHLGALGLMWWQSLKVDLQDKGAIAQFYQFIWKLFFWEYLIFPAACLLT